MKKLLLLLLLFSKIICVTAQITVTVSTTANPPANRVLRDYLRSNRVTSTLTFRSLDPQIDTVKAYVFGRLESLSSSLTITTDATKCIIDLGNNNPRNLSSDEKILAFGNFTIDGDTTGINPDNIVLPDGTYRICFFARDDNGGNDISNIGCSAFFVIANCTQSLNAALINTTVKSPVNPVISQSIQSGGVTSNLRFINPPGCSTQAKLFGKIERLSPSPFTIELNPDLQQPPFITLNPGSAIELIPARQREAFGNFDEANLIIEGIDPANLKDAINNIKLPDGNYRICYYARYITSQGQLGETASNPNLGCGTFTICNQAGGAPQFTQPINNFNITSDIALVRPASPVIFTWTPPQSTCGLSPGGFTYDFEIRELFNNQTVADALNNPFVFRKTALPSTTFLLDTTLYKNVLQQGRRYAIRVRAISTNTNQPVEIDNDGYSRIEAFQYGGNLISVNDFYEPQDYYLRFGDRKSAYWDDLLTKYKAHQRGDTSIPLKEYIAFALTQNGIAYNLDAIELFLTLNPDLVQVKKVKLSHTPILPVWPDVPLNDLSTFDKDYQAGLEPDKSEENKFLKYLDTLNAYRQKVPGKAVALINDLAAHLNNIRTDIDSVDRTTVDYINNVMAELLYQLRQAQRSMTTNQYNQLQNLAAALKDLTTADPNSTSYLQFFPLQKQSSLTSHVDKTAGPAHFTSSITNEVNSNDGLLATIAKQLRPFNVVVYRNAKDPPYKPVLDAPDLTAAYRIFFTLTDLYNHKNPAVNAKSTTRLASTVQVPLPSNTVFTFWTLNMLNHKTTKAQDVDLKNVMIQTSKVLPEAKKLTIVLKVD